MEDFEDYYFYDDESAYHDCPKCGRSYDEIDYDHQTCSKCGWDAEKGTWVKPENPNRQYETVAL